MADTNISRRAMLAIPLALAAAGSVVSKALAGVIPNAVLGFNPSRLMPPTAGVAASWFGKLPMDFSALRVQYAGPEGLSVAMHSQDGSAAVEFDNLRALIDDVFDTNNPIVISKEDAADPVAANVAIRRAANLIAARTRRGMGNNIFVHAETIFNLDGISQSGNFKITSLDCLRPDELLVIYDNTRDVAPMTLGDEHSETSFQPYLTLDGPFVAEIQPDGRVKALILQSEKSTLGNATDFGRFIRVV